MPNVKKKQHTIRLLLFIGLLLVGGCKQPGGNTEVANKSKASGNDQKGYLHSDDNAVMFIRWTEVSNKLSGQLNVFYAKGNRGKSTETSSHSFEGVSDGESLSLNFTGSIWRERLSGKTWTGSIKGDELTLVIPTGSGVLAPVKFKATTVEEYNQTVFSIKQGVRQENARVQQENAEASRIKAEKNAVAEGNDRIRSSINQIVALTSRLEDSIKLEDELGSYSDTWRNMKANYDELLARAAEKPLTSHRLGTVEHALGKLQHNLGTFEHHSGTLGYKIGNINNEVSNVRDEAVNLRKSWDYLQRAVAANSSSSPTAQFSENDISQFLRLAEATIKKASGETERALKQKRSFENQASALYKKAESFVRSLKATDQ